MATLMWAGKTSMSMRPYTGRWGLWVTGHARLLRNHYPKCVRVLPSKLAFLTSQCTTYGIYCTRGGSPGIYSKRWSQALCLPPDPTPSACNISCSGQDLQMHASMTTLSDAIFFWGKYSTLSTLGKSKQTLVLYYFIILMIDTVGGWYATTG